MSTCQQKVLFIFVCVAYYQAPKLQASNSVKLKKPEEKIWQDTAKVPNEWEMLCQFKPHDDNHQVTVMILLTILTIGD